MREYRWFLAAWLAGVVGYEYLLLADAAPRWLRDGVVGTVVLALPLLMLDRARRTEELPDWARPLAAGSRLFLLAHLLHVTAWSPALVRASSVADVVELLGAGLLLLGLVLALRPRLAGVRRWVALDGLAGALAGAAAVTWAVVPLVGQVWDGSWAASLVLAGPLLDAVLAAAALGAVGLTWPDQGHRFGLLAGGTVLLAVRDVTWAYQSAAGAGQPWLHGLVPLALGMLALGALGPTADSDPARVPGRRSLVVPGVASVVAVAVLAGGPDLETTPLPTLLAVLTCVVCGVRFVRAFVQLRELAVIREQALTDELTGIANRRALYQHLDELLPDDDTDLPDRPAVGVALIDLDHFKEVNDTLGHAAGDGLLKAVVGRFAAALAELDTPHLLARLGGDEFAVVLHEATSRNAALIVGSALQESLAEPVELPEGVLHAQASIGLAVAPDHGRTRSEVLFAADAAMYQAKTSGSSVAFHAPSQQQTSEQLTLAEELYRALERHELGVEYQPIVQPDGTVLAAEAFVRWDHPERGRLEAAEFLEAAGRYKLTAAIAKRVLEAALADLARWRAGGISITVSVNLSAEDLRDESVVSTVASALIAHDLPGEVLTIDISEADIAEDPERVTAVITALDEIGVRIAVDDYGVGGVPLTTLVTLPLDEIKLDRTFTRDAAVSTRCTAIVKSVLDLTHALGLRMVAEGVEDRRAHAVLKHLGCDLLQGRHLGRPAPAAELEGRLFRPTGGKHRLTT